MAVAGLVLLCVVSVATMRTFVVALSTVGRTSELRHDVEILLGIAGRMIESPAHFRIHDAETIVLPPEAMLPSGVIIEWGVSNQRAGEILHEASVREQTTGRPIGIVRVVFAGERIHVVGLSCYGGATFDDMENSR